MIVPPQFVSLTGTDNAYLVSITVLVFNPKDIGDESIRLFNSSAVTLVNDTLAIITINHTPEKILLDRYVYVNDSGESYSYLHIYSDDANNVTIDAFQALLMQVVYGDVAVEIDNSTRYVTIEVDDGTIVTTVQTEVHVVLFDAYDPVFSNSLTSFNFTEDSTSPIPLVSPSLTLSDLDNNVYFLMGNATISLTSIPASSGDNVSVDISFYPSLIQRYDPITGVLVGRLSGDCDSHQK